MLFENTCNGILRFFVGVKLLVEDHTRYGEALNFLFPVLYACSWLHVYNIASTKNGHYGAPPGLIKREEKYEDIEQINQNDDDLIMDDETTSQIMSIQVPNENESLIGDLRSKYANQPYERAALEPAAPP